MGIKRKLSSYYISKVFEVRIATNIRAETFEEAVATAKAMRFGDFIDSEYELVNDDNLPGLTVSENTP